MSEFQTAAMPVSTFAKAETEVDRLLEYPGIRPHFSFMTDGFNVRLLPDTYDEFCRTVDTQLAAAELPLLDERIPVLAYGANANPVRLRDKMRAFGADKQAEMQTVPHLLAAVPDTAAVWHGRPGQTGSAFAELYNGPEAAGGVLQAHLQFLTPNQLAAIHATEGDTYSAALIPIKAGTARITHSIETLAYVALDSQVLLFKGRPVRVSGMPHHGSSRLPVLTAAQAVDRMLLDTADQLGDIPEDPISYITEGLQLNLKERKLRQARVGDMLLERGFSRKFAFAKGTDPILVGRADFASLPGQDPHLLQLPEMLLRGLRPSERAITNQMTELRQKHPDATDQELRVKAVNKLDPARRVSRRAHDELKVRHEVAELPEITDGDE